MPETHTIEFATFTVDITGDGQITFRFPEGDASWICMEYDTFLDLARRVDDLLGA